MDSIVLELEGLDCGSCADKIEEITKDMKEVYSADLNFVTKKLRINIDESKDRELVINSVVSVINNIEPNVIVLDRSKPKKIDDSDFNNSIDLELDGLDCAGCADQIQEFAKKLDGVENANVDFVNKKIHISKDNMVNRNIIIKEIVEEMERLEPHVIVKDISKSNKVELSKKLIIKLDGLDCAGCADQIQEYTKKLDGVENANVDFVNKKMVIELENPRRRNMIVSQITDRMFELEPHVKLIDITDGKKELEELEETTGMKSETKELIKIAIGAVFFVLPFLFKLEGNIRFASYFIAYLVVGHDVILTAFRNIKAGNAMDEHFLMTIATIAAFITGEYPEGVMVMLLYKLGEYFQGLAVNHSRRSISSAMDIRPDYANLVSGDDSIRVSPEDVMIGDEIIIRPGERVPLDGIVIQGESSLDTSNITGESIPRTIKEGEEIVSGVVNTTGLLKVRVNKEFGESTITQILDLVENASSRKAPTENFITKFSRVYTPIVVGVAAIIAIIPSLFFGGAWGEWLYRAAVFLVISCPCALVISVPLGFFGGIGAASKEGVLVKGGNYLEALNDVDILVFDKTGTITEGSFKVNKITSHSDYTEDEILEIGAYGEAYSNHPIGKSIIESYGKEIDKSKIKDYKDIAGKGISVNINGKEILLGNESLLDSNNIDIIVEDEIGTLVYISEDNKHIGSIVVSDGLKPNIKETLLELKSLGIKETIMLSGDNTKTVEEVAKAAGITKSYGDLMPQDKVEIFEDIIDNRKGKSKVAFVGDGVNDAPVLARADIGIAMGGLGSDAAIEASDIVIMNDEIYKISTGLRIASKTKRIVMQNIILALGVKLVVLALGAFGVASMWQAVFADVGVSIIAIFNSIRALKVDKK